MKKKLNKFENNKSIKNSVQKRIQEIKRNPSTKENKSILSLSDSANQMSHAEIIDRLDVDSEDLSAIDEEQSHVDSEFQQS